ncbi:uncharacterized protein GBIM_02005 [Gryllus bimaculatus]|nr:uncharacterized protein GBIM_02005 [Gryllus bimaculatus]
MTRSLRWRMTLTMTSRLPKSAATMMKPMAHDLSTTTSTSSQAAALAAAAASPGEAKNKIKKSSYEIDYSVDIPVPKSEVTHVAKPLNNVIMAIGVACLGISVGYIYYMRQKYEKLGYYAAVGAEDKDVFLKRDSKWDN